MEAGTRSEKVQGPARVEAETPHRAGDRARRKPWEESLRSSRGLQRLVTEELGM